MPPAGSRYLISFILLILVVFKSQGQILSSAERKLMKKVNLAVPSLPKDLQSTKTVVIISLDNGDERVRGDWKALAEEAHFYIRRLNIDAVLYFYVDDAIAGFDVQRAITAQLVNRDIRNVLLLSKDNINGRDQFIGIITAFNKEPTYIANNQAAWRSQTSDIEILFRNLARSIDQANLKTENLLIIDAPEYYRPTGIIRGRRFEIFNTDLRIDRLAVPKFMDLPLPEGENGDETDRMKKLIELENQKNLERNSRLELQFAAYPYQYEIVPYEYDEKKLLTKGFQFVLMRVSSSEDNVRRLLEYKSNDNPGQSKRQAGADGRVVHKFYVKHINSGDIYLGEQWDAAEQWPDALYKHMTAIVEKLSKR